MRTFGKTLSAIAVLAAVALSAGASDTQRWVISDFGSWSAGEAKGVEINSLGQARPGWDLESSEVPAEGVWAIAQAKNGDYYLGTGDQGKLFCFRHGEFEEVADTDEVAISQVRIDEHGRVWFSTIPGGKLYKLEKNGDLCLVFDSGQAYIWDFIFDARGIVIATGPAGKIFRVSWSGDLQEVVETGEDHVMCLAKSNDGRIQAGTYGDGLVLELTGGARYQVLHNFEESEVKKLVWVQSSCGPKLIAATNLYGSRGLGGDGANAPEPAITTGAISGGIYELTPGGGARLLLGLEGRAALDMAATCNNVYVATDQEGKIFRRSLCENSYSIAIDLEQSQALSLLVDEDGPILVGAGGPAAAVKVSRMTSRRPTYLSKVFDAAYPAQWGAIDWEADGFVTILTRSGNIADPTRGWSPWKALEPGKPGQIKSPSGRFLQVKIAWPLYSEAVVRSVSIPYRVLNQPAYVTKVEVEPLFAAGAAPGYGAPTAPPSSPGYKYPASPSSPSPSKSELGGPGEHKPVRTITWEMTNPDGDPLQYWLCFQAEDNEKWIPIKTTTPYTRTSFDWDTSSIPDGWYRVRVEATDGAKNPNDEALGACGVSDRFMIDNHTPEIKGLIVIGCSVSGVALDKESAIEGIQYSLDGGDWLPAGVDDGVIDSPEEKFKFTIDQACPGSHVIAVRAWDRAQNVTVEKKSFSN